MYKSPYPNPDQFKNVVFSDDDYFSLMTLYGPNSKTALVYDSAAFMKINSTLYTNFTEAPSYMEFFSQT